MKVSVLVHAHTPRVGRLRAAAVGGVGFVRESAMFRTAFAPFGSNAYGPDGAEQMQANTTSGLVFGGDIELFVTKHVVIGPQMRVSGHGSTDSLRGRTLRRGFLLRWSATNNVQRLTRW